MAEFSAGIASRYGKRSAASAHIVETGWYKPMTAHGAEPGQVAEKMQEQKPQVSLTREELSKPALPPARLPAQRDVASPANPPVPSDVRFLETVPERIPKIFHGEETPCAPFPGPEVRLPDVPGSIQPVEETQDNPSQSPLVSPQFAARASAPPKGEDSLTRFLSAQVCAAVVIFGLACLFKLTAEPVFQQIQEGLREGLSNMQAVCTAAGHIQQMKEKGIQEVLREALSKGLENDGERIAQGQTEIILSVASDAPLSSWQEPAGGAENPSGGKETAVSQAVAAGGTYPVSMEQVPYALSVMQDGRRSSAAGVLPTKGMLTCEYGPREHPITGKPDFHTGIDIGAPLGTPIYAAAAGVVERTGKSSSLGSYLMLRHGSSTVTTYSHCSRILVKEGEAVACGQTIAQVGSTGVSTGPHLHFECIVDGTLTDPAWILELPLPAGTSEG